MLEGKTVNLRVMEKSDIDFFVENFNKLDSWGRIDFVTQISKEEMIKEFDSPTPLQAVIERKRFIIEKKDGTKIGWISHRLAQPDGWTEIGVSSDSQREKKKLWGRSHPAGGGLFVPNERYCSCASRHTR